MESKLQKLLGARIKELRNGRGLSQEKLAELIGIDVKHLSRVETGVNAPSVGRLESFSVALGVPVRSLFDYGHLDGRDEKLGDIGEMLKKLDENDLKIVFRVVRGLIG